MEENELTAIARPPGEFVKQGSGARIVDGIAALAAWFRRIEKPINGIGPERCFGEGMVRMQREDLAGEFDATAMALERCATYIQEPPGDARYPDPKPRGREWNHPADHQQPGTSWWISHQVNGLRDCFTSDVHAWFSLDDPIERQKLAAECSRFIGVLKGWADLIRNMAPTADDLALEAEEARRSEIEDLAEAIKEATFIHDAPTLLRLATTLHAEVVKAKAELAANPPPIVADPPPSDCIPSGWIRVRKDLTDMERQLIAFGEAEWAAAMGNRLAKISLAESFDELASQVMGAANRFGYGPDTPPPSPLKRAKPKPKRPVGLESGGRPGTFFWAYMRTLRASLYIRSGTDARFAGGSEAERQQLAAELARFSGLLGRWAEMLREAARFFTASAEVIAPEVDTLPAAGLSPRALPSPITTEAPLR